MHNHTGITAFRGGRAFAKTYGPALSTGVAIPTERAIIEARTHHLLRAIASDLSEALVVASVLSELESPRRNIFELHPATNLRSLPSVEWPSEQVFFALGNLSARVCSSQDDWSRLLFDGLDGIQHQLGAIIRRFKGVSSVSSSRTALCLGDFGLSNLALLGTRLLVFDFEFAHRERPGFDAGQILAELEAHRITTGQDTARVEAAVLDGYSQSGGPIPEAYSWRDQFYEYYSRRYLSIKKMEGEHE